jgi:hypothetical protein
MKKTGDDAKKIIENILSSEDSILGIYQADIQNSEMCYILTTKYIYILSFFLDIHDIRVYPHSKIVSFELSAKQVFFYMNKHEGCVMDFLSKEDAQEAFKVIGNYASLK